MEHAPICAATAAPALAAFTVDARAMADAVAWLVRHVVPKRADVPPLEWLRLSVDPRGVVTVTATDLDIWAAVEVPALVQSPGTFCTDARLLSDTLAKVKRDKGAEARFTDGQRLQLANARGRWSVVRYPVDDFPTPIGGIEPGLSAFTMPAPQFIADLAALEPCQSSEETRYYLNGIALQRRDMAGRERLVMAATDGHAMGIASRELPQGAGDLPDCIVPRRAVAALVKAGKLASDVATLSAEYGRGAHQTEVMRFRLGAVAICAKLVDGTYPDWPRVFGPEMDLAPTGAQACLFPDLLPGVPVAQLDKLAKVAPGALTWEPTARGMLATVAGDEGLLFGACNLTDADDCGRKGFSYRATGATGEIEGPDGVTYPVAFTESAIHLSKEQVRALIGESCFETFAVTIAGAVLHILQWLWDDGASRFLSVRADGRCYGKKDAGQGVYVNRAQIEAALSGEYVEIASPAGEAVGSAPCVALDSGEGVEALCEAPSGDCMDEVTPERAWVCNPEYAGEPEAYDPGADLAARVAALEARLDALSVESEARAINANNSGAEYFAAPTVAKRTAAHERAIRRAWNERKARRAARFMAELKRDRLEMANQSITFWRERADRSQAKRRRAVLAAWAQRKARRAAELHLRIGQGQYDAVKAERDNLRTQVQGKAELLDAMHDNLAALGRRNERLQAKRKRAVLTARRQWKMRLVARYQNRSAERWANHERTMRHKAVATGRGLSLKARRAATFERQRAGVLHAQLAALQARINDPATPDRPSDIAMLAKQRDDARADMERARAQLAAVSERNQALQCALDKAAHDIDGLASRVARAEAVVRRTLAA